MSGIRKIIIAAVALAAYGINTYYWAEQRAETQAKVEGKLEEAAEQATALLDNDAHAEMLAKGRIRKDEYEKLLKPLTSFHLSRPDLAHIYTAAMYGDEVYSVLDTAKAVSASGRHQSCYPGKSPEKINAPDPSLIKTLEEGVKTLEKAEPNRKSYGADIAIYEPIIRANGRPAGALAVTMNNAVLNAELTQVNTNMLVRTGIITLALVAVALMGRGNRVEVEKERTSKERLEEQFRTMTERLPGAVFIFSTGSKKEKGELLFASAGLREMRGLSPEAAAEKWKDLRDVLPEEDQETGEKALAKARKETGPWETEFRWDGKWIQLHAVPRKQEDRTLWFGTLIDITNRKSEEEKLAATNEILRRISQSPSAKDTLQAICEFGAEGTGRTCIIHLNGGKMIRAVTGTETEAECADAMAEAREICRPAGAAAACAIGEDALHITSIKDSSFYVEAEKLRETLRAAGYESTTAHPLKVDGKLVGVVEFLYKDPCPEEKPSQKDTQTCRLASSALERISTLMVLQENERRYHTLFETSPVGICEWNEENQKIFSNTAFETETDDTTKGKLTESHEEREEFKQGNKTLLAETREIQKANGQAHRITFVYDISEQKYKEESAISSKEAAEAANKAKSEFLAVMSHEIRTPLNGVIGFAQMLEGRVLGAKERVFVSKIRQSGETLLSTINDILNLSKIEAGKVELEHRSFMPLDTLEICRDLVEPKAMEKNVKVILQSGELPPIKGDEARLRQIVMNLAGNAAKFTEAGEVRILAQWADDRLTVKVKDTGIGISPENQKKLFQPFSQADSSTTRKFGGTGLGLVISKRLCELMGGEITLESEVGKGTTFTFWIPAPVGEKQESARYGAEDGEDDPLQLNILVAEDDEINRLLIGEMLKGFGHEVEFANDGLAATTRAEELKDWAEVMLMDMQMPGIDGLEATRRIRASGNKDLPIVALTANAMEEDRERCLAAGMDNYLAKPIEVRALKKALKTYQEKKRWDNKTATAEAEGKILKDEKTDAGTLHTWGFNLEPEIPGAEEVPIVDRDTLTGCLKYIPKQAALSIFERMKASTRTGAEVISSEESSAQEKAGAAHKMVGAVGTLGCSALGALAKELELHYLQSEKEHPKTKTLKELLEKTIAELEKGLEDLG